MHKTYDSRSSVGHAGWLWTAAALLPLALMGCQPRQPVTSQNNSPEERVAGEREEQGDSEALRVVQEASLPRAFAFGGRTWRAHQVHWVNPGGAATTTTPNAPGTTSTDTTPGSTGTMGTSATGGDNDNGMGGFVAVGTFMVDGHQIYRCSDADEAVTDNIYIQAENVRPPANGADGTIGTTDAYDTANAPAANAPMGDTATGTGMPGTATTNTSTRIAFVEYDADENLVDNIALSQLLQATGLPATVQHGGKTWKADEIQVYDADVFDDLKAATQNIGAHTAFMGDDKDKMWLQAELDPTMLNTTAGTTAATGTGDSASEGAAPSTGTPGSATETVVNTRGPIFVEYEAR